MSNCVDVMTFIVSVSTCHELHLFHHPFIPFYNFFAFVPCCTNQLLSFCATLCVELSFLAAQVTDKTLSLSVSLSLSLSHTHTHTHTHALTPHATHTHTTHTHAEAFLSLLSHVASTKKPGPIMPHFRTRREC